MINHIPPIGAKRMMAYMAMENMKPIDKTNTLLDQTMGAKYARSVMATVCLLYTSPSPRDGLLSRMPSSA